MEWWHKFYENKKTELIGIITATKCDADGNTKFLLNMNEVSYTPNFNFNLFRIGKRPGKVWNIQGNYEAI